MIKAANEKSDERSHSLLVSGSIVWCCTCGSFTESRMGGLKIACAGKAGPQAHGSGGVRAQLVRLRANKCSVTQQELPPPTLMDGTPVRSFAGYSRLEESEAADPGFVRYIPETSLRTRGGPEEENVAWTGSHERGTACQG